jgi:quercetin dioxygenase-like cupin family protein
MRDKKGPAAPACDWTATRKARPSPKKRGERVRLHRHRPDYSWSGVKTERYKTSDGTWQSVIRRVLAGGRGEDAKFHLRYFEVSPGGHTTLERHRHEHVVVVVRGRGKCLVKKRPYEVGFLDTLYIPPDAPHQIQNPFDEPFGFLCVVDAKRDAPRAVGGA